MKKIFFAGVVCCLIFPAACKKEITPVDCNFTPDELQWLVYDTSAAAVPYVFIDENNVQYTLNVISKVYSETAEDAGGYTRITRMWDVVAQLDTHDLSVHLEKQNSRNETEEFCGVTCTLTVNSTVMPIPPDWVQYPQGLDTMPIGGNPCPRTVGMFINPGHIIDLEHVFYSWEKGFAELNFQGGHCYKLQL